MTQIEDLRTKARALFDAAVTAADPAHAVRRGFALSPLPMPQAGGRTFLIAIGKAAPAMLGEALVAIPDADIALAITHHENETPLTGSEVLRAGHPVPDEAGARAAQRVMTLLSEATEKDRIIALISGGGSALLPAPPQGVSLTDKARLNDLLLSAGLDIVQMNLVRQQVSLLKGGGFLRLAAPASVYAYLLSDVIGDDLRAIASGPTVGPIGTAADAIATLKAANIWDAIPTSIRNHLESNKNRTIGPVPMATNTLVGSNRLSLEAMAQEARTIGLTPHIVSDALTGDVADAAQHVLHELTTRPKPTALLFGGETTVKLRGTGKGGRNQELALRVAMGASDLRAKWVFLSGGTDGRDGPTDAAGGLVDAGTLPRITAAGQDADVLLANNDSYAALAAGGDLLMTRATGTNVADVQVLLIAP
ncbi:MAG: glycerate kinase type-2 family protein [Marivita sp.]|uniref:glycerate kinase type-2 family protein n=1 Tax=Marivita sp. TaxID=2003365 RepID=UPI003EF1BA70